MVVNMGNNHCVQGTMDTRWHPGECGHKIMVFQENANCRILVLVGWKEMKNINDNETVPLYIYICIWYQNKLFSGSFNFHDTHFLLLITILSQAGC